MQTILPLTHTGLEDLDVGKTTWSRTCQTKTAQQTFEKMQKVQDETTISLDSSTVKQAFSSANLRLVHLSFCGPAPLFVKLWRQSRRAQKPDANSACTHCTVFGGHVANGPASSGTEGCCSRVAPGVVKASRCSSPLPARGAVAEVANACSRTG